jgi:RecA/RadA recombinase
MSYNIYMSETTEDLKLNENIIDEIVVKSKNKKQSKPVDPNKDLDASGVFESLDKLNPESTYLSENALSNVDTWYDTGCYALNAIISGSCRDGGVPKGRLIGFSGPSQSGKSYIINKILANAQKRGVYPVIFDTEFAIDDGCTTGVGLDPTRTKYVPVYTVEQCRNQVVSFLDSIVAKGMQGRFIISIDSLGNLASQKEVDDAAKDKSASDMGTRAKGMKSMMRILTYKAGISGTTILFSNHTYDDPAALHPTLVKQAAGGSGPQYMASILVQLANKKERQDEKNEGDEMLPESRNYSGSTLRFLTTKNRFIPPFLQAEIYLNFKTGLDKYSGITEMAVNHGVLTQTGATFQIGMDSECKKWKTGDKIGYKKNWSKDLELWENFIIPELDKKLEIAYKYGK